MSPATITPVILVPNRQAVSHGCWREKAHHQSSNTFKPSLHCVGKGSEGRQRCRSIHALIMEVEEPILERFVVLAVPEGDRILNAFEKPQVVVSIFRYTCVAKSLIYCGFSWLISISLIDHSWVRSQALGMHVAWQGPEQWSRTYLNVWKSFLSFWLVFSRSQVFQNGDADSYSSTLQAMNQIYIYIYLHSWNIMKVRKCTSYIVQIWSRMYLSIYIIWMY